MPWRKKLSWLLPDDRGNQRNVLKSLAMTGSVDIARETAKGNGQSEWFEKQLKDHPDLPDTVKKSFIDTRSVIPFNDDNEAFNKSLDKYLDPEQQGMGDWENAFNKNKPLPQDEGGGPFGSGWGALNLNLGNPSQMGGHGQQAEKTPAPPSDSAGQPNNDGSSFGGIWNSLLQRMDDADKDSQPRQLTDNRKFEYSFVINGAPGQSEQGIADSISNMTKTNPTFTGNNSMLDGGTPW